MPARESFQYAVVRVVPRVERGECLNAGVAAVLAPARVPGRTRRARRGSAGRAGPGCNAAEVRGHLETLERVAAGDAAGGPIAALDQSERFHWLTAPSSTIVQTSPVHTGLTADPVAELEHLFSRLVAR